MYGPVIGGMKTGFAVMGLRFVERGLENIPQDGGAVLAINHVSYFDFIFAGKSADPIGRYVRFMAKEPVFRHRVAGPLMRGMKHIPVDREAGAGAYSAAVRALREGELVGVFPEGTTSRSYTIKQFKTGAARMAAEAGVPLIPVITWGGQHIGRPPTIPAEKKTRIVLSVMAAEMRIAEAARRERVSEQSIGRWKAEFLEAAKTA